MIVASYCSTFLKPEMLHVYRQITGLKRVKTFVMTKSVEHARRFPFGDIEKIPRPHRNYLRHGWMKFVQRQPALIYRGEHQLLVSILERRGADMMHIYFGHTGVHLLPFIRGWNKPCVVSFHGADVALNLQVQDYAAKLRVLFDAVPVVLARSQSIADRLVRIGCDPAKIRINRTGFPLAEFPFRNRELPRDGEWRIVQACRLIEKKGLATAIRAFAQFAREFPAAEFHVAGKGELQTDLQRLAYELGVGERVRFLGFLGQSDLRNVYHRSHIFLHPSETPADLNQEGVPNSMLEAMATGLPVVATRHGGIPEAVTDGLSGYLHPERDAPGVADSLLRIARSPSNYVRFSRAAREKIAATFDQSVTIRNLERVYEEVAAEPMTERVRESGEAAVPLIEPVVAK